MSSRHRCHAAVVKGLVALGAVLLAAGAAADTVPVEPYAGATLERHVERATGDYALPLGAWRRVSGDWRMDRSERLEGTLERFTWRIPDGHSPAEAHRHWLSALQPMSPRSLFSCRGRGCGPSNQWANAVFDNRNLYGPDGQQWLDAVEVRRDGRRLVLVIYTVERGNRRVYSHVDVLVLGAGQQQELPMTADGLLVPLREQGQLTLAAGEAPSVSQLDALALALQKDVALRLFVVAHAYGDEPLAALQAQAGAQAEQVVAALVERGVPAERLHAVGLGPVAPGASGRVDRVELVRIGS